MTNEKAEHDTLCKIPCLLTGYVQVGGKHTLCARFKEGGKTFDLEEEVEITAIGKGRVSARVSTTFLDEVAKVQKQVPDYKLFLIPRRSRTAANH